jgi:TRAP-type C4-dicarboxylate transport system permease large subunit
VGTVLYVVCGIGNIQLPRLVRKMLPFVLVEVVILFLLVYFPKLSLVPMRWLM